MYEASPLSYLLAQKAISKFILSISTIGAIASKKCKYSLFVNSLIESVKLELVNGPEAMIVGVFGILVTSSLIKLIFGFCSILSVTVCENLCLSIANAFPAGT